MNEALSTGAITLIGRHPSASNAVFVVQVGDEADGLRAIYKPIAAERALWDFPDGMLARREVAAHRFARALGMDVVPETVWRDDAPHGPGSLQRWIESAQVSDVAVVEELEDAWLPVLEAEMEDGTEVIVAHRDIDDLRAVALLDALMNNADRKAGHLLRDDTGALWAVDHGVTFHAEPKLRTVLWGFAGQPISNELSTVLTGVPSALAVLTDLLDATEIEAVQSRADSLLAGGVFPAPSDTWPSIPWPIF